MASTEDRSRRPEWKATATSVTSTAGPTMTTTKTAQAIRATAADGGPTATPPISAKRRDDTDGGGVVGHPRPGRAVFCVPIL